MTTAELHIIFEKALSTRLLKRIRCKKENYKLMKHLLKFLNIFVAIKLVVAMWELLFMKRKSFLLIIDISKAR
jgi:hypothetical protein